MTTPTHVLGGETANCSDAVDFGSLRVLQPVSRSFGFDRGLCIDRYYIEKFLAEHAPDIRGRVLEVADREYTTRFGGTRVERSDVLHATPGNRKATIVGDLADAQSWPEGAFDCVLLTQTLQHIYDVQAAASTLARVLKPGGVLLLTAPGISQISRYDMDRWGDFWRFTDLSLRRLLEKHFPSAGLDVRSYGNVLAAIAFLHGLSAEELSPGELDFHDRDYPLLLTVRAQKASP